MASGLSAVQCMPQSDRNEPFVCIAVSGGVYMGKLAPARVSYRDDFVISYHVYMMSGFFHHPTSNVLKLTKPSWIDKNYACATRSSLPANQSRPQSPRYPCPAERENEVLWENPF